MDDPAPLLKDGFSRATVAGIAQRIQAVEPDFDTRVFTRRCLAGFDELSLMARVGRVAGVIERCLPSDFPSALSIVERAMGDAPAEPRVGEGIAAFRWAPFLEFVAIAGLDHPEQSLAALRRLTRHFSGEFAIRPFLDRHLDLTLAHARLWVTDPDERVRRLASEGTRPLLPWGRHIAALKRNPSLGLDLIEPLAADVSGIVRRSAANHLNDASRLDAELALAHAGRWARQASQEARQTVRHALRTLVKKGDRRALALLGYQVDAEIALSGLALSARRVPIGGELSVSFALCSTADAPVLACVDYAVIYAGIRGAARRKVFKGLRQVLAPGVLHTLAFKRDFTPRTTRMLYPGPHAIEVLVNGALLGRQDFELMPAKAR